MFVVTQDKKSLVNLERSDFVEIDSSNSKRLIAQIGYFNNPKTNLPNPIVKVLGEYETEEDAQIAFDKVVNFIRFGFGEYLEMPPYNTDEDGM